MLREEKFSYSGKERHVLVLEETDTSMKGIDISYANDSVREAIMKAAEPIDSSKWKGDDELAKADVQRLKECGALSHFRHFKKASIVRPRTVG
jgi:hypothetical protein